MCASRRIGVALTLVTALALQAAPTAQVATLSDVLDRILASRPALTTSLDTAAGLFPLLPDDFEPESFRPATWLARTATGGFVLEPGAWEFRAESYCLKAGTPRPARGDGFALAPFTGPRAAIIQHILENAGRVPAVTQEQIQVLLWAIVARTDVRDFDAGLQRAAAQLLTPGEMAELSTDTLGRVAQQSLERNVNRLPAIARQVFAAEAGVRELIARHASYAEIAAAAVLDNGDPGRALREIPRGRWIGQAGYFVRFLPEGYARTTVQLYVPGVDLSLKDVGELRRVIGAPRRGTDAGIAAARRGGATYEPGDGAAVPGNAGGQRLGVSSRMATEWHPAPPPWGQGPRPSNPSVKPPRVRPSFNPGPPARSVCDPSRAQVADAQGVWSAWADSLEMQARQYDDASACPPTFGAEEEAQFAYARAQIAAYGGSSNARERDYASCLRTNVVNYRANQQVMCDNVADHRRRLQDHARRARNLESSWSTDPKRSYCTAQQQVKDAALDAQPGAYKQPAPLTTCMAPQGYNNEK